VELAHGKTAAVTNSFWNGSKAADIALDANDIDTYRDDFDADQ